MNTTQVNPHYERIGGEEGIRRLVDCFYKHMDELPDARHIRNMHAPDLSGAKTKLFRFLSGWLGGPALYVPAGQSPRLGHKHEHFPIGHAERDQWLKCMQLALAEMDLEPTFQTELMKSFGRLANSLVNKGQGFLQPNEEGKKFKDQVVWLDYPIKRRR